jgi:hypothetical protein
VLVLLRVWLRMASPLSPKTHPNESTNICPSNVNWQHQIGRPLLSFGRQDAAIHRVDALRVIQLGGVRKLIHRCINYNDLMMSIKSY